LDGNEVFDELERHKAHSQEWLCHEDKKEFNAAPGRFGAKSKRDSSHPQADAFAGAKAEEKIGPLRSE